MLLGMVCDQGHMSRHVPLGRNLSTMEVQAMAWSSNLFFLHSQPLVNAQDEARRIFGCSDCQTNFKHSEKLPLLGVTSAW